MSDRLTTGRRAPVSASGTWLPELTPASAPERERSPEPEPPAQRYRDLGQLGYGGMGEVRRVLDTSLDRPLAMKILAPALHARPDAVASFLAEAGQTARLEHPGIVPVHEIGRLEDGRLFFTMKEVRGRTLQRMLRERAKGAEAPPLRRLVDVFHRVCEAVAYAHAKGVVHRDLKPDNVMVGAFGEVLVLDWGIAARVGVPLEAGGRVPGTPEYMAPELVRGGGAVDPRSDVWALGVVLGEILGALPGEPVPEPAPPELAVLVAEATRLDPAERPGDAGRLAERVEAWLEGARRRERADELVARARGRQPRIEDLRRQASTGRAAAQEALDALPSWAEIEHKRPLWEALDRAEALGREAALVEVERDRDLHAALREAPDHAEAQELLADGWIARHEDAVARHDAAAAARYEALLRGSPCAPRHRRWLEGTGAVTLRTDGPARVEALRFQVVDRRLVAVPYADLGEAPLVERELPHGSWLLRVRHPAGTVNVPVHLGRLEHWDGVAPGEATSRVLRLPRRGELGPDDVLVPAGWCRVGGDPLAYGPLPGRRVWVEAFVVRRFPVTEPEFRAFVEDLRDAGRAEEAERYAPCNEPALGGQLWARGPDGRFVLDGRDPRLPAHGVDWFGADAYARWLAARTGLAWRLPTDVEWEKAARGADGRCFPFGDHPDPVFCCIAGSHRGAPAVAPVDAYPLDESPYGVRGLAGNVRDWVSCRYERNGAPVVDGRMAPLADERPEATRIQRGGAWSFHEQHARAATRWWQDPVFRHTAASFRVARGWA